MEVLPDAFVLVEERCSMDFLDLKDAYLSVPVEENL